MQIEIEKNAKPFNKIYVLIHHNARVKLHLALSARVARIASTFGQPWTESSLRHSCPNNTNYFNITSLNLKATRAVLGSVYTVRKSVFLVYFKQKFGTRVVPPCQRTTASWLK